MKHLRLLREELSSTTAREAVDGVLDGYREHDLLTFASAIAFQILFAIIPLALFGLGLLGGFGLEEQWTEQWAAKARDSMSPAAFEVVDDTVRRVLGERQLFWTSAGALIAVWKLSSATRAVMDVFDRIYGSQRERSFTENLRVSLVLGTAVGVLVLAAAACAVLGDDGLRSAGLGSPAIVWLRWPLALALLFAVVALLVARAPVDRQPVQWVTLGSLTVVTAWVGTSLVLGWYLTSLADYGSVFGALATIVVVLTYLYLASAAFLTGAEVDARIRARVAGRA